MGLFADLILGEKCKFCGSRSLENYIHMSHSTGYVLREILPHL